MAAVGPSNLQLSGGEPTLRDDLPEIVEIARRIGYSFIQVNTNGLRLAADIGLREDGSGPQVSHRSFFSSTGSMMISTAP